MKLEVVLVASVFVCIFVKWLVDFVRKCRTLPPGPWGVPVFGYFPWLTGKPHEKFCEIAKRYGNVFSVTLGSETVVVLNDWPSVKEALVDQAKIFRGRPKVPLIMALSKDKEIVFSDGPVWQAQRRLMIRCLRSIGMGKKSMETRAMDMVQDLIDKFSVYDGKEKPMLSAFFGSFVKLIWNMVADAHVEEAQLKEFEKTICDLEAAFRGEIAINVFPWLRYCPPNGFGYWEALRLNEKFLGFIKKVVGQHLATWNEAVLHDFVDFYMADIKSNETPGKNPQPPYDMEHLFMAVWILFIAGVETTNSTSLWGFLYLACNPEAQQKTQAEMDQVVGRHRLPTLDDIPRLPYLEAVIMEVHRMASMAPLSVAHMTMDTATVGGYTLPKNTTVLQNIYAIHHDPTLWNQPELFKPERFLDENNVTKVPPYFMPFSLGPRLCVGKAIAELELRLIFSCLLHQFRFSLPPHGPKPTMEPQVRLTLQPQPYSLHIELRK